MSKRTLGTLAVLIAVVAVAEPVRAEELLYDTAFDTPMETYGAAWGTQVVQAPPWEGPRQRHFRFDIGTVFFERNIGGDQFEISQVRDNTQTREIDTLYLNDMDFLYQPGLRTVLEFYIGDKWAAEVGYTGLVDHIDRDRVLVSSEEEMVFSAFTTFSLFIDPMAPEGSEVGSEAVYWSNMEYFDAKLHRYLVRCEDREARITAGFRYLNIDETFGVFQDFLFEISSPMAEGEESFASVYTYLVGPTIGGNYRMIQGPFEIDVRSAVGFHANLTEVRLANIVNSLEMEGVNQSNFDRTLEDEGFTFSWELAATASFVWNQHVTLELGYELLMLTDIAVAPTQLSSNVASGRIDDIVFPDGSITASNALRADPIVVMDELLLYHGPKVMLSFIW